MKKVSKNLKNTLCLLTISIKLNVICEHTRMRQTCFVDKIHIIVI